MNVPKRIQLRRTKGWRKPDGAIVVSRPSKWGNPYAVSHYEGVPIDEARGIAARDFEMALYLGLLNFSIEDVRRELKGKDLCCWCPDRAECHADVLLECANRDETSQ